MYVCLCNGFTDRDMRRCAEASGGSVAQVYKALGQPPRCGKCVSIVRDMVRRATNSVQVAEETA